MIFWQNVPIKIYHKCWHIHKIGKKLHKDFTKDYGDIPIIYINEQINKEESIINNRGYAYAKRKDIKYRKKLDKRKMIADEKIKDYYNEK